MFDYSQAFSRNLGIVTREEQEKLRTTRVAVAGLGGVGGIDLLTLVRMGISKFSLCEFDRFEQVNFNRQFGATVPTVGREKLDVMIEMATAINPEIDIHRFPSALSEPDLEAFFEGVSVFVDSIDFFTLDIRRKIYAHCRKNNIPVVMAAPLGLSSAWIVFDPKGMSFDEYFRFDRAETLERKALHFLVGLTPKLMQRSHIVDFSFVNFRQRLGPSLSPACVGCAAHTASEVFKLIVGRGKTYAAPWVQQFDLLNNRHARVYNWNGNSNPLSRFKIHMLAKQLGGL